MPSLRSGHFSEQLDDGVPVCVRVANKLHAAMHKPDSRNPRLQVNGSILIVQDDDPATTGQDIRRESESHSLDAYVGTAACDWFIRDAKLNGKINREPWVSILESMHKLRTLVETIARSYRLHAADDGLTMPHLEALLANALRFRRHAQKRFSEGNGSLDSSPRDQVECRTKRETLQELQGPGGWKCFRAV